MNVLSQIMALFALIFWVWSVQQKDKNNILKFQTIANIFYAIQYFMLGVPIAASMNLISILRNIFYNEFDKRNKQNPIWMLLLFVILISFIGIISFSNYLNLIPVLLTLLYTYITWQKNTVVIRWGFIIAGLVWIFYNTMVGAYVSLGGNFFELIFGFISVARFDLKKKEKIKV